MKFLIIEQDLRISGTSQGIISRSFLVKLRKSYPDSIIDVVYLKNHPSDDQLHLLPINNIETHVLNLKIPFFTKFKNRFYWRLFHISLNERHIHKVYGSYIANIDYRKYNHIFIRSAGLDCETILGAKDLPILKQSILTFNEPYPNFWCTGSQNSLNNLDLFRLKEMQRVIFQSKSCMATELLSQDMQYLYGSRKKFYTLPHQFSLEAFDFSDQSGVVKKTKKIAISYHGAIQFGRNADNLLDAYQELISENSNYKKNTEFILRLRGQDNARLAKKYEQIQNIKILDCLNFSNSSNEQIHETDITIILENGPLYCNILVGKAPFLAAYNKPVLCLSPLRSELRNIIKDKSYIANMNDKQEIKEKLALLIENRLQSNEVVHPFGDYFSDDNFKKSIDEIISL
ncbi:hypothetical protein ACNQGB_11390 [Flavobacterium sp. XS1P32]|jgi:hypothetical protein|uniref:hypothetical protein n=1 Tax=Flavobacterium sp. XS1P32 TaxID=3401726 RepID=UPI003AAE157B